MRRKPLTNDPPEYGDRKRTIDRRDGERRAERKADRRRTYPGAGRDARLGHCRECGVETSCVVTWKGKATSLCPPCGRNIREAE